MVLKHVVQAAQMAQAAARSNGATQMSGLELARARVTKCEADLSAAREQMRVAAKRAGVSGNHLLEFTEYIPRETGSRWKSEGVAQGHRERDELFVAVAQAVTHPDHKFAPLRAWAAEMLRKRRAAGFDDDARVLLDDWKRIMAGDAAPDFKAARTARAILAAAERRDRDPSNERPEPGGLAGKILAAARKRDENK